MVDIGANGLDAPRVSESSEDLVEESKGHASMSAKKLNDGIEQVQMEIKSII